MRTAATVQPEVNENGETSIGIFFEGNSIAELVNAAKVVCKLGQVPELRIVEAFEDIPQGVELYVRDIPSMARTLARSIAQNGQAR